MQTDLSRADGLTLVELIVSLSLLTLAISMAASLWMVGRAVSKDADRWGDRNEQLRTALNAIGHDLTYALPYGDPARPNWCCSFEESWDSEAAERQWIEVAIYHPRSSTGGWHAGWVSKGWPGWITQARSLRLRYVLMQDGSLVRQVRPSIDASIHEVYVHQTLMTHVHPDSYFYVDAGQRLIQVTLKTEEIGGNPSAEATSGWQLRNTTPN